MGFFLNTNIDLFLIHFSIQISEKLEAEEWIERVRTEIIKYRNNRCGDLSLISGNNSLAICTYNVNLEVKITTIRFCVYSALNNDHKA